jgi:hypothetical protein
VALWCGSVEMYKEGVERFFANHVRYEVRVGLAKRAIVSGSGPPG